jgi:hypothetical protein
MFYRDENGRLTFKKLDFEIMIADIIDEIGPKDMKDLEWMVTKMVNAVQLCAWEYVNDSDEIEDEWEDIFYEY